MDILFLVIEDEKPVVYSRAVSRMDLDTVDFIHENSYEDYDIWDGDNLDMANKYYDNSRNVKKFNYMKHIDNF